MRPAFPPANVASAADARRGSRGLSAYAEAEVRQIERDNLRELLAEWQARSGAPSGTAVAAFRQEIRSAHAEQRKLHSGDLEAGRAP